MGVRGRGGARRSCDSGLRGLLRAPHKWPIKQEHSDRLSPERLINRVKESMQGPKGCPSGTQETGGARITAVLQATTGTKLQIGHLARDPCSGPFLLSHALGLSVFVCLCVCWGGFPVLCNHPSSPPGQVLSQAETCSKLLKSHRAM